MYAPLVILSLLGFISITTITTINLLKLIDSSLIKFLPWISTPFTQASGLVFTFIISLSHIVIIIIKKEDIQTSIVFVYARIVNLYKALLLPPFKQLYLHRLTKISLGKSPPLLSS